MIVALHWETVMRIWFCFPVVQFSIEHQKVREVDNLLHGKFRLHIVHCYGNAITSKVEGTGNHVEQTSPP